MSSSNKRAGERGTGSGASVSPEPDRADRRRGRHRMAIPIAFTRQHQDDLQVLLDDAVEDGLLRMAKGVRSRSTSP